MASTFSVTNPPKALTTSHVPMEAKADLEALKEEAAAGFPVKVCLWMHECGG